MSRPMDIETALEACLAAIEAGVPVDDALTAALDVAEGADGAGLGAIDGADFRSLVSTSRALGELPGVDPARHAATRAALVEAAGTLYPPPPAGWLARMPTTPVAAIAAVSVLLTAWLVWRPAGDADMAAAVPRAVETTARAAAGSSGGAPNGRGAGAALEAAPNAAASPVEAGPIPPSPAAGGSTPAPGAAPAGTPLTDHRPGASVPTPVAAAHPLPAPAEAERLPAPSAAPGRSPTPAWPADPPLGSAVRDGGVARTAPSSSPPPVPTAMAPAPSADPGRQRAVTGRVADASGMGIPDAVVTAYRIGSSAFYIQRTGADGAYRLRLQPGAYVFRAAAAGHQAQWYRGGTQRADATVVDVSAAQSATGIDFLLRPLQATPADAASAAGRAHGTLARGGSP